MPHTLPPNNVCGNRTRLWTDQTCTGKLASASPIAPRIRLSDWFHRAAHGGAPSAVRAAEAVGDGRRAQQHRSASVFAAGYSFFRSVRIRRGVPGSSAITDPRLPPKRTRSKGPFLRQHDPASPVVWPSPTPVRPAACATVGLPAPSRDGSPPMTRTTLPPCRAPYPGGSRRGPVSIASPLTRPSPFPRRVGIRIFTFEAYSGFTRVTARWIAQPPKAAFVTRLRPGQLPGRAARQLPDQSTTLWVEPSSTGDPRRRGARRVEDGRGGLGHAATPRFPSPLIKPDVRISRIRLSDWFHRAAHGGAPSAVRAAEAASAGRRAQQHRSASVFAAG